MNTSLPELELIDLYYNYDAGLLDRFYTEVLVPSFNVYPDDLESADAMHQQLSAGNTDAASPRIQHIAILQHKTTGVVLAGMSFEYFKRSNVGLVAYLATNPHVDTRGLQLSVQLVDYCTRIFIAQAKVHGHGMPAAVFMESNSDAVSRDVMVPARRRSILSKLGTRYLDFDYVSPHVESGKQKNRRMLLGVASVFCTTDDAGHLGVQSDLVKAFLVDFYTMAMGPAAIKSDVDVLRQLRWLETHPFVPLEAEEMARQRPRSML
ncbi:Aste57867_24560 [Aphanomyces stellatus]|uniref:Aste57867_24560 protein n=1 Tax=Aphanomyces stellatus TaxID=120398 RepID=A0A485LQS7_9STRA|nr:hypothetical protein As57867_024482 [Aphanomyces stellatus]VFU01199.1 Aste57867_24560 [Aphanomyces stellatus]